MKFYSITCIFKALSYSSYFYKHFTCCLTTSIVDRIRLIDKVFVEMEEKNSAYPAVSSTSSTIMLSGPFYEIRI